MLREALMWLLVWAVVAEQWTEDEERDKETTFCHVVRHSSAAKEVSANVDEQRRRLTLRTLPPEFVLELLSEVLEEALDEWRLAIPHDKRARLCDPNHYRPHVEKLDGARADCSSICRRCFAGSFAVCVQRSRFFRDAGLTCICTYVREDPIQKAAFSIRDERRVFNLG